MKKIFLNFVLTVAVMVWFGCQPSSQNNEESANTESSPKKTNVIYILADDLGYGDLGSYGQEKIKTPNLDRMAEQGMRFTQHYSGSTVCAPSRSSLMTGQHTGHTPIRGNKEVQPEGQEPLPAGAFTLAELFEKEGYVTGAFGKWGLGFPQSEGDPNNQGFEEFYGYNCQRLAHNYYPYYIWHNDQKIELEGNVGRKTEQYAQDLVHEETLNFIEANKDTSFFLFMPYIIPHAELLVPDDSILAMYEGQFPETPYEGVDDGPRYKVGGYGSQPQPHAVFAAMVTRLDVYVGQVLDKLEELGIAENTLVIFTSDNGPHVEGGADPDFFDSNGPLKGYKRDLYEGGIRVPTIAWWPNTVKANSTTEHISAFWDVLPTMADLLETDVEANVDGISFLPTLTGEGDQQEHEYLYWEFTERGGRVAVRKGDWKAVIYDVNQNPDAPIELYDLSQDLGEENNIAEQHPEIVEEMKNIMKQAHQPSELFNLDVESI